ncbi:MAG: STAS domain-containing protein [Gammaproteobacteria bacterium]|nr:STAS domain-containing protein [Gammaproteobacteria bacterium]
MSVTSMMSSDGDALTINVSGRFDFSAHQAFRDAHVSAPSECEFIIDMGGAEYMDSSALGMLLMLREHAGGEAARVRITNCKSEVRHILTIANFQKLFRID